MTARQAKIAASLYNAIYLINTDTPGQIEGVPASDVDKIRNAQAAAARRTLARHDYQGPMNAAAAVQFAIDNY